MARLGTILDQIDSGAVLLPEFQRGYVWNRDQVRGLMRSLYRDYPVGALLVWETTTDAGSVRGADAVGAGVRQLLLDGQQRITTLYGLARGKPPAFFEGDASAFKGLMFNVVDETFEFYAPAKMRGDARWISVTDVFLQGLEPHIRALNEHPETAADIVKYMTRLNRLREILNREFHAEKITGADKTVDIVVDIFNRVNSGGTKLSKGDLALAKLCADWPDARATMRMHLSKWSDAGYDFTLDWLLRSVTAITTGRSQFSFLDAVSAAKFQQGLAEAEEYISAFLDVVRGQLGLDHDRVLMGRYSFPVICRYLHLNKGSFPNVAERNRLLFWYVHAALRGRFAGSTETVLNQDYDAVERGGVDGLISELERWRGSALSVSTQDFEASTLGSRFYPLLYMLTRVRGAQDFGTGLVLSHGMLGNLTSLQVHHIFPKALLYQHGYNRQEVNSVANFCLLTQATNLAIGKRPPEQYFPETEARCPGALASQWIPTDQELWKVENYRDFLAARRELLAAAANELLSDLRGGRSAPAQPLERVIVTVDEADEADREPVRELVEFLVSVGCTRPVFDAEITDQSGEVVAIAEAFWPDGLQPGRGNPVVLELDRDTDLARLESLGYEVFTSIDALRTVVQRRNEEAAGLAELAGA